jgi:NAD(P)H-dependent flavin oxidoreductase YrpB (nitropropane dioxygenase family)
MLHTRICDLFRIAHPVILGRMGGGHTAASLVAAVSNAGGLGILGVSGFSAANVQRRLGREVHRTDRSDSRRHRQADRRKFPSFPHRRKPASLTAALQSHPPVVSFAWLDATRICGHMCSAPTRPAHW